MEDVNGQRSAGAGAMREMGSQRVNRRLFDRLRTSSLLQLLVLCIGAFGSVLPSLPDMFPNSKWVNVLPALDAIQVGYADLSRMDEASRDGRALGILRDGDTGYSAICDLLRVFDPTLTSEAANPSAEKIASIAATQEMSWSNPQGSIAVLRPVLVELVATGQWKPVCDMRDLAFLIHDNRIRLWSRVGSFLAFTALLLQAALLIGVTRSSRNAKEPPRQIDGTRPVEEQAFAAKGPVKAQTSGAPIRGLRLAILACIAAGVLVLLRFKKRC
jgi:hypothetical protein